MTNYVYVPRLTLSEYVIKIVHNSRIEISCYIGVWIILSILRKLRQFRRNQ